MSTELRLAQPELGEEELEAVRRVFASGHLTNGPETVAFEREFAERHDVGHAVAVANGTVGLQAIHVALGIGPGDEVITPSLTFISSATSVLHVGATPVFADIRDDTFNLDPKDVASRLTERTKAIVAVHYGGQPADLDELRSLADEAGAHLIEDAAQAHGATYRGRPVGGFGTAAMFSFTPTKNITTGEGGVVTTDDAAVAERIRLLRNHGQTSLYRHELVGFNWRMTEMQAAIGRVQLSKLDGILETKRQHADAMDRQLTGVRGVRLPVVKGDRTHPFMLYSLLIDHRRDEVLEALISDGIEARVYFPPAHTQPVFAHLAPQDLPVTQELGQRLLSVPLHAKLAQGDLTTIANAVRRHMAA